MKYLRNKNNMTSYFITLVGYNAQHIFEFLTYALFVRIPYLKTKKTIVLKKFFKYFVRSFCNVKKYNLDPFNTLITVLLYHFIEELKQKN